MYYFTSLYVFEFLIFVNYWNLLTVLEFNILEDWYKKACNSQLYSKWTSCLTCSNVKMCHFQICLKEYTQLLIKIWMKAVQINAPSPPNKWICAFKQPEIMLYSVNFNIHTPWYFVFENYWRLNNLFHSSYIWFKLINFEW